MGLRACCWVPFKHLRWIRWGSVRVFFMLWSCRSTRLHILCSRALKFVHKENYIKARKILRVKLWTRYSSVKINIFRNAQDPGFGMSFHVFFECDYPLLKLASSLPTPHLQQCGLINNVRLGIFLRSRLPPPGNRFWSIKLTIRPGWLVLLWGASRRNAEISSGH